jgi:glycosyltransferase involved in cell wall biosynthesis
MLITLSIIVPVYNVEKYILECVNSLLAEKSSNVEIILINDGSKDQSANLIKTFFANELVNQQIRLLEQENQGVSAARNLGLAHAQGAYIGFVDADDLILHGYYSSILSVIERNSPDIVEIGWKTFVETDELVTAPANFVHRNFGLQSAKNNLNDIFSASIWYPVIRFFRRELLSGHAFPVGVRFCEDLIMLSVLYDKAEKIFQIEQALYAYRVNPAGATMNMSIDYMQPMQDLYISLLDRNEFHIKLLKISIFYVLYRCMQSTARFVKLDKKIEHDLFAMRLFCWRYISVGMRRWRIFMFPRLSNILYQLKNK